MKRPVRLALAGLGAAALVTPVIAAADTAADAAVVHHEPGSWASPSHRTSTPIKHVVVIFGENVSFDHYFATYPRAANLPGETLQGSTTPAPRFTAAAGTPSDIATLAHDGLLAPDNPNASQPERLTPGQAVTCDQDHNYTNEQKAYHSGAMDQFVEFTSEDTCSAPAYGRPGLTMNYYDGNTVAALWNYAQHYAMSDHAFSTTFGPSTPGAINLVSGQTHGVKEFTADGKPAATPSTGDYTVRFPDANGVGTMTGDPDPVYDDCSNASHTRRNPLAAMTGRNIGDLLNAKRITWGWFQGGFTPTTAAAPGKPAACLTSHRNVAGVSSTDYNPHHQPFQYYASTANPHHLAPASLAEIGHAGRANHQYDLSDFDRVVASGNLPAVSFLKAANYQDGHAGYSDPIDEQRFIVKQVNAIQQSKHWKDTAIILAYDDSDGWYDHVAAKLQNASNTSDDAAFCRDAAAAGVPIARGYQDRCGPGPRQPLIVVSPFARTNYVDHRQTDQASILRLIEDNWGLGRIGDGSADAWAGSLGGLFTFGESRAPQVVLGSTGAVTSVRPTL
ncbi:phospholipase C [Terrabacter tumescens]|uniref:Phospholipase C n=1 Tax=Terrabacter tumescens TaxID=60443 RepID=A0ABQ2ICM3_9MICO|nr:alkaline phosphatase family protein [Terrabacter tumescens]GGN07097.1 phospholipase C [Terrabacter tumescens]